MSRYTVKNGCIMKNMFHLWEPPIVVKSQSEANALCTSVVYILDSENEDLAKSVQFLNDSNTKLQAENDAIRKALLTCSVKRQELQAENDNWRIKGIDEWNIKRQQIAELQAENQALRETILGEVTTADDFNSEFRHNPDDDAPDVMNVEDKHIQYKGAIKHFRMLTNKHGEQMAEMLLDSYVELVIFPRILHDNKFLLEELVRSGHKATFNCSIISANSRTDIILDSVVTNYRLAKGCLSSDPLQCDVCGNMKTDVNGIFGKIDIIMCCKECLDSGRPLLNNFDS